MSEGREGGREDIEVAHRKGEGETGAASGGVVHVGPNGRGGSNDSP